MHKLHQIKTMITTSSASTIIQAGLPQSFKTGTRCKLITPDGATTAIVIAGLYGDEIIVQSEQNKKPSIVLKRLNLLNLIERLILSGKLSTFW